MAGGASPAVTPTLPAAAVLAAALLLCGCDGPAVRVSPADLVEIRTYTLDCPHPDPQPAWNPVDDRIAVRVANGFAIMADGRSRQDFFAAKGAKDRQHPCWLDGDRLVMGSSANVITLTDGRVVPPSQPLELIELKIDGTVSRSEIDQWGFRPRLWPGKGTVVTQVEDRVRLVDPGKTTGGDDFVDGFYADPEPDGEGLAWTSLPIIEPDRWIGGKGWGSLVVRWSADAVDTIPGCLQPRWLTNGRGLIATRLKADPPAGGPWWSAGTEVVWIAGHGKAPVVIHPNARDGEPHPVQDLVAVSAAGGGVDVVALSGGAPRRLATQGSQPSWNHAGDKLLVVEPVLAKGSTTVVSTRLVVRAYGVRPPAP